MCSQAAGGIRAPYRKWIGRAYTERSDFGRAGGQVASVATPDRGSSRMGRRARWTFGGGDMPPCPYVCGEGEMRRSRKELGLSVGTLAGVGVMAGEDSWFDGGSKSTANTSYERSCGMMLRAGNISSEEPSVLAAHVRMNSRRRRSVVMAGRSPLAFFRKS